MVYTMNVEPSTVPMEKMLVWPTVTTHTVLYRIQAWSHLAAVFNWIPVSAYIGETILCMNGGLSPYLKSLEDIDNVSTVVYHNQDGTVPTVPLEVASSLHRSSLRPHD